MSSGRNLLPKFMPIPFFSGVYLIFKVFQDIWYSKKEILGVLECYPVLALNGLKLCKFVSRSDLVLISSWMPDHVLDFLSYLVLQLCISFCSVSDKSGASLFLPCSHQNAVAHMPPSNSRASLSVWGFMRIVIECAPPAPTC